MRLMTATMTPEVSFQPVDGVSVRYADSARSQGPTVLLTSPWPESVYAFAPVWAALSEHARLFAVDLPGFGASERRDDLLSPRAMGEFLSQLITATNLGAPHLVAPDVGTSAALFAVAAHPEQVASAIVGAGAAAVPLQLGKPLESWVLDPDLDKYLPGLAELLPQITTPVTIITGRHDRDVPLANAEFLDQRLPASRLEILDAGHFVWEEAPEEYSAIILDTITDNHE
jgi:pimeloyl-ACP methyl ester carboxylesterase